jgi:hypothetical protein
VVDVLEAAGIWAGIVALFISVFLAVVEIRKTYYTKPKLQIHFENDPSIDTSMYRRVRIC